GGSIVLKEREVSAFPNSSGTPGNAGRRDALNLVPASERGSIDIGKGVLLSVAGNWTNDTLAPLGVLPGSPRVLDGGSITVSGRKVDVSRASFDLSAGATLSATGGFSGGRGGGLTIGATDQDITTSPILSDAGKLKLGANFAGRVSGFGVTDGGSITLKAPHELVVADSAATANVDPAAPTVVDASLGDRGFATFA